MLTKKQYENNKRLIEVLPSGRYVQGYGRLRTEDNRFCCMGVATDLIGGVCGSQLYPEETVWRDAYGWDSHRGPRIFDPSAFEGRGCYFIDCINDEGYTFSQIAEFLQRWLDRQWVEA